MSHVFYGSTHRARSRREPVCVEYRELVHRLLVSDDVNPLLFAGEAAFLLGVGRRWRLKDLKWAEPRAGLC